MKFDLFMSLACEALDRKKGNQPRYMEREYFGYFQLVESTCVKFV